MKLKVKRTIMQEVDVASMRLVLPVRYGNEDMGPDFPGRRGDVWDVMVDFRESDGGAFINGWPPERGRCELYMKVTDGGCYYLLDRGVSVIAAIREDYVPHGAVPGRYGDYVHLDIQADGRIANWPNPMDISAFFQEEA